MSRDVMTKLTRTIALALLTLPQVLQAGSLVECQNEHRVIYSSPDPNRMAKIAVIRVSSDSRELAALHKLPKVDSPQRTRWMVIQGADFTHPGTWSTTVYVFGNRANPGTLKIEFRDHANGGVHEHWINEKLVALDVWWGRILSTALVLDVESGKWLYAEEADYSEMIQPCEGEQSKPGALNRPIQQ